MTFPGRLQLETFEKGSFLFKFKSKIPDFESVDKSRLSGTQKLDKKGGFAKVSAGQSVLARGKHKKKSGQPVKLIDRFCIKKGIGHKTAAS
jgi:hypothetical protein